jgi:hypothetical protein
MKLKLLNGSVQTITLRPTAGAYDAADQELVIHVQGDGTVGTLIIPVNELRFFVTPKETPSATQ